MASSEPHVSWDSVISSLAQLPLQRPGSPLPDLETAIRQKIWTTSDVASRREAVEERKRLLAQATALNETEEQAVHEESRFISLAEGRVHNSNLPIHRLPVEIFRMILHGVKNCYPLRWNEDFFKPVTYAKVCHIWFDALLGPSSASLWTQTVIICDAMPSLGLVMRASHSIRLTRSRPYPFSLFLKQGEFGLRYRESPPKTFVPLASSLISELSRVQSLEIKSLSTLVYSDIIPLNGIFSKLRTLILWSDVTPPLLVRDLFGSAILPCLATIKLIAWNDVSEDDLQRMFGNQVAPITCSTLVLCGFAWQPQSFARILRTFSNVTNLVMQHGGWNIKELEPWIFPPEPVITMPSLIRVDADHSDFVSLLRVVHAPQLTDIDLCQGYHYALVPELIIPFHQLPNLQSLRVYFLHAFYLDPPSLIASRDGNRSLLFGHEANRIAEAVLSLIEYAKQRDLHRADLVESDSQPHLPFRLSLAIYPTRRGSPWAKPPEAVLGELTDDEKDVLARLEALATKRGLREQAYGPDFRIHLEEMYPRISVPLATLASRFPEFLVLDARTGEN